MATAQSYLEQRLSAVTAKTQESNKPVADTAESTIISKEQYNKVVEENQRLQALLERSPPVNLISESQKAFESSLEFEQIYSFHLSRYLRERFAGEFRQSGHWTDMQAAANAAYTEFINQKKGEQNHGQIREKNPKGAGGSHVGQAAKA